MRFVMTVISAAILLFLLYLVIGGIADGYFGADIVPDKAVPDAWAAPDSLSEWRDIVGRLHGNVLDDLGFARGGAGGGADPCGPEWSGGW